jgi:hypothetical protein
MKAVDGRFTIGDPARLTAGCQDHIQLALAIAIRKKRQPLGIGRPLGASAALFGIGELKRLIGSPSGRNPDLGLELVLLPVRL